MVFVVLRDGRVLQYNAAMVVNVKEGAILLFEKNGSSVVAHLPLDVVERVESSRPCSVKKDRRDKRTMQQY